MSTSKIWNWFLGFKGKIEGADAGTIEENLEHIDEFHQQEPIDVLLSTEVRYQVKRDTSKKFIGLHVDINRNEELTSRYLINALNEAFFSDSKVFNQRLTVIREECPNLGTAEAFASAEEWVKNRTIVQKPLSTGTLFTITKNVAGEITAKSSNYLIILKEVK